MIKLGVVALSKPEYGGTYQYTLSTLQALRHTTGFAVTLYGDPDNLELRTLGFPISPFSESRKDQLRALAAYRLGVRLSDPFASEDVLLAPIYALTLLHTPKPFAFTLHDLQERYYPQNFSLLQRTWHHQVYVALLARACRVICESRYVQADIVRFFGIDKEKVAVTAAPPQKRGSPGTRGARRVASLSSSRRSGSSCSSSCRTVLPASRISTRRPKAWKRRNGPEPRKL